MLVGKGITFDTGGLSIKPGEAMANMKRDMTGGAVVIAVHGRARRRRLPGPGHRPGRRPPRTPIGGNALRPGDVIRHYGGRTTEVTNTDAEGRLVLADALAYAVAELDPDVLVDVATLTGAMKVALGQRIGGFFANDEALADAPRRRRRGRRRAAVADAAGRRLRGAASAPRSPTPTTRPAAPGAITAALFLQHFAGDVPWAHLDLASVGDAPDGRLRVDRGPDRLRRRVRSCTGSAAPTRWRASADERCTR